MVKGELFFWGMSWRISGDGCSMGGWVFGGGWLEVGKKTGGLCRKKGKEKAR